MPPPTSLVGDQITKIVETVLFHVPNFGQRFSGWRRANPGRQLPAAASPLLLYSTRWRSPTTRLLPPISPPTTRRFTPIGSRRTSAITWTPIVCQPSYQAGGTVAPYSRPTLPFGISGADNPYWAIGKDAAPFMSECATRITGTADGKRYTLYVDYYVEFWNMSTRDVAPADLKPNPFIRIASPPKWAVNNSVDYKDSRGNTIKAFTTPDTDEIPPCDDPAYSDISPSNTRGSKRDVTTTSTFQMLPFRQER